MKSFVTSQFGYCPLIWMFHSKTLNNKINFIHERALRITYNDRKTSFEELLRKYNTVLFIIEICKFWRQKYLR